MTDMDPDIADFARAYRAFTEAMTHAAQQGHGELTPVGERVRAFLGVSSLNEVEPISETFPLHQVVDVDLALDALLHEHAGSRYGISGINLAHVDTFSEFLVRSFADFAPGAVSYERKPDRPGQRSPGASPSASARSSSTACRWPGCSARPRRRPGVSSTPSRCSVPARWRRTASWPRSGSGWRS